jgi:cell wall-associated NlpC family hydrolase
MKKIVAALCLVSALWIFSGCAARQTGSSLGLAAAKSAHDQLGVPYVLGGRSPKGFDCSGLVWFVYRQHGVDLPDASWKQVKAGRPVDRDELAPGDLVFFQTKGRISHVGLYVGAGKMIHAPGRGKTVVKVSMKEKYFLQHFAAARRVAGD